MLPPTEYTFTVPGGWVPLARKASKLPVPQGEDDVGDVLFALGYKMLGQSGEGRCAIGHFLVWQRPKDTRPLPRYALEIPQLDDTSLVWVDTLPALWEFLRLYGEIGFLMGRCLPGDHEEEDDDDDQDDEEGRDTPTPWDTGARVVLPFSLRPPTNLN